MLEPKHKDYSAIEIKDITSSSDSESESEIATPSVSNLKSKFSVKRAAKPLVVQPIHEPVIRREPIYLRNRFHKEPTNQEDIIRSDQPGTKEKPDYSFNVGDLKKQFTGAAPKISRPITEPLPNKSSGMSRTKSAPLNSTSSQKNHQEADSEIVRSQAGVREEAVKPEGGLAAIRSLWQTNVEESNRGRTRSRRPDPIDLKEEAREVKIRDKSQRRESRHARRAASAGRGTGMKVYNDGSSRSRREESKSPPRRKKTPAPVKKEVKKEVKVEKPVQVVERPKTPEPEIKKEETIKAVGVEEAFDLMSVDRSLATTQTLPSPTESNRTDVKDDFDLLNGDSFNDPSTVKDIKKDIKEPEDVISTKSSEIDFEEPSVQEIVPKKDEEKRASGNISTAESPVIPEPLEIIDTSQEQVLSQIQSSSVTPSLPNLSENLPASSPQSPINDEEINLHRESQLPIKESLERTSSGWLKIENDQSSESESIDTQKTESTIALAVEQSDEDQKTTASGFSSNDILDENSPGSANEIEEKKNEVEIKEEEAEIGEEIQEENFENVKNVENVDNVENVEKVEKVIQAEIKEEAQEPIRTHEISPYGEYLESQEEENLIEEQNEGRIEEEFDQLVSVTKAISDKEDSEDFNEQPLSNISEATEEFSPNGSLSKDMNIQTLGDHQPINAPLEVSFTNQHFLESSSSSDEEPAIEARRTIGFAPEIEILNDSTDDEIVEICKDFKPTHSREPTPPPNLAESSSDYSARSSDEESTDPEIREAIQQCSMQLTEKIIKDSLAQVKNESIVDDFDLLGDLGSVSTQNAPPGGSNSFDLLA